MNVKLYIGSVYVGGYGGLSESRICVFFIIIASFTEWPHPKQKVNDSRVAIHVLFCMKS